MKHLLDVSGNYIKLSVTGKMEAAEVLLLRDEVLELIDRGAMAIYIEVAEVSYVDNVFMEALLVIHKRLNVKNGKFVFDILDNDKRKYSKYADKWQNIETNKEDIMV